LTSFRHAALAVLGVLLAFYVLIEVNFHQMQPQAERAIFLGLGWAACFLTFPTFKRWEDALWSRLLDIALAALSLVVCGYLVTQDQPLFKSLWLEGTTLGDRAGFETSTDIAVGAVGLLLTLEAARRAIGWIVPALSLAFLAHNYLCHLGNTYGYFTVPEFLLPQRGHTLENLVGYTFLQSSGVLGQATDVMFKYVFLFIFFGALLEMSGATQFIIRFSQRLFGDSTGAPAKMSVVASGLMGSLSGSAVANAVTTGAFTIPMMKKSGLPPHEAAAVEAAAGAGGALVPPVMGAGAYMMLETVQPAVTFGRICLAAILPAALYYFSLLVMTHLTAKRVRARAPSPLTPLPRGEGQPAAPSGNRPSVLDGLTFFVSLVTLIAALALGYTAFRAVSLAALTAMVLTVFRRGTGLSPTARAIACGVMVTAATVCLVAWGRNVTLPNASSIAISVDDIMAALVVALVALLVFALAHPRWRPAMLAAMRETAKNAIPLIAAAACVGIIIGVVQSSNLANAFGAAIGGVVEDSLLLALIGIMVVSLILGMGVPSVVCYLLVATILGPVLTRLGVPPLLAHLFIFYFGLMSMVTPPVALAAYAAASIAGASAMRASLAAFRNALVGFTLPFMFVYRPELALMTESGAPVGWGDLDALAINLLAAIVGIVALAAGLTGYGRGPLGWRRRATLFAAAAALLAPDVGGYWMGMAVNVVAAAVAIGVLATPLRTGAPAAGHARSW